MPETKQKEDQSGVVIMEVLESIRSKLDDTREEVIKVGTLQQTDRKLHDERHADNLKWRDEHKAQHEDIIVQLKEVNEHTQSLPKIEPGKPLDKNLMMKLAFGALFLLIALIYGITGNDLPSMSDIATVTGVTE